MRLLTDEEIDQLTDEELNKLSPTSSNDSRDIKQKCLKQYQRTRGLAMWHDHGTILGLGVVMITVHIVYDPVVFYTQTEIDIKEDIPSQTNIQATVENPAIHFLVACSSSVEECRRSSSNCARQD